MCQETHISITTGYWLSGMLNWWFFNIAWFFKNITPVLPIHCSHKRFVLPTSDVQEMHRWASHIQGHIQDFRNSEIMSWCPPDTEKKTFIYILFIDLPINCYIIPTATRKWWPSRIKHYSFISQDESKNALSKQQILVEIDKSFILANLKVVNFKYTVM